MPIELGTSGQTLTLQTTESGGFTRNGEAFASGTTVEAEGSTYRLSKQNGVWTAAFVPPPPVMVPLGDSGQVITLQVREDGQFEKDGQLYLTGSKETVGGLTYRLDLQNGMWTAVPEARQITVTLGISGRTVTILAHPDGRFTNEDGQPYLSGATETVGDRTYRLVLEDGAWTAEFVRPRIAVPLGASGQDLTLLIQEDGTFTRTDGRPVLPNSVIQVGDDRYRLELRNGMWTASFEAPAAVEVRLGNSGESITLVAQEGGTYVRQDDGSLVRPNDLVEAGGNRYRLVFEGGEWIARYQAEPVEVQILGAGDDRIILLLQENGDYQYNDRTVEDGDTVEVGGNSYQLTFLRGSREWLAERTSGPAARTVQVTAGTRTITLTRTSTGTYTYEGNTVRDGSQITVGEERYVLTQDSAGNWSARAVGDPSTINPGGVGGPTQADVVDPFTADTDHFDTATVKYGVQFTRRGVQTLSDRGTRIVPLKLLSDGATTISGEINSYEFPVYDLMQQALVSQERTFVEVAKAKLEDIVSTIQLRRDEYAADTLDPDTDIAGANRLWQQAKDAVGRIFGYAAGSTDTNGVLGGNPWKGQRLDVDEVDAVVEALQDTIAVLSDSARFAREFENQIADVNEGPDNTPDTTDDLSYSARDFFDGDMYRIRFGSTDNTRFGAYAVKKSTTSVTAHAAIDGMWEPGVFAYTPSDEPNAGDIPSRGEAKFNGNTVAVQPGTPEDPAANGFETVELYAGKIELIASFTRKRVSGTVTELKDEGGKTFEYDSGGFGKETVRSISLASALLDSDDPGLFKQAAATDEATLFFVDNLPTESDTTDTAFTVQFVEDATEALGVWKAFGLEGSFGATRTGSVGKPTLPAEADRGGKAVQASIHVITNGAAAASGSATSDIIDPDNDDNSQLTLSSTTLGLAPAAADSDPPPVVTQVEFDREFPTLKLRDLYSSRSRSRRSSNTIASRASAEILKVRNQLEHDSDMSGVETILSTYFGLTEDLDVKIDTPTLTQGSNESNDAFQSRQETAALNARRAVADAVRTALGRDSSFKTGLAADGIFTGSAGSAITGWDDDRIRRALTERRWDFALRFARTKYTRFGVWSQIAPQVAGAEVAPEEGSFAYSPLGVAANISLSFAATYSGTTLAVNEKTGHLYSGKFDLSVNWESGSDTSRPIRSTITDLKGVHGTSAYFQHDNKDVKSLFFTGVGVNEDTGTFTAAGNVSVRVNYRTGSSINVDLTSTGEMAGVFVMDSTYEDEPVGVLGVWSIPEVTGMSDAFTGSFGADLVP